MKLNKYLNKIVMGTDKLGIITDIKGVEYCYSLKLPPNIIDVYDFSKVSGKNDIFKIGTISSLSVQKLI